MTLPDLGIAYAAQHAAEAQLAAYAEAPGIAVRRGATGLLSGPALTATI